MITTQHPSFVQTFRVTVLGALLVVFSLLPDPVSLAAGGQQEANEGETAEQPDQSTRIEIEDPDALSDDSEGPTTDSAERDGPRLLRNEAGDLLAPIGRPAWVVGLHSATEQGRNEISQTIENGYIPAGVEVDQSGELTVLYLAAFESVPEQWLLETYEPNEVNDEVSARLLDGWNPLGFSVVDGVLSVLYGTGGLQVAAWRIHQTELDPERLAQTIQSYQTQGYALVDLSIDPATDQVWYFFVQQEQRSGGPGSSIFVNAYPIGESAISGMSRDFTAGRGVPIAYASGSAVAVTVFTNN